ncbi:hypothetical protein JQX13_10610 [Archangium violaceum]|uniref:DUF7305 domain-containing protein n=1 Tax=Archangium violaceum TaxID=83451 RepID=UPI00193BB96E|nr:hypothetical protein [Archangium violaceum]QRK10497.1 hypothetical protein JQX13_10610 [Archangium violaceum]
MPWRFGLLLALVSGGGWSCSLVDPVASLHDPEGDGRSEYCAGQGSTGFVDLAAQTFQHALCTCEGLTVSTPFVTDAFRSSQGPWSPGGRGASIGTNGDFSNAASMQVGGSLQVGGTRGIQAATTLSIAGELRTRGSLEGNGPVSVEEDAHVGGDITLGELTVGGILTLPPERNLSVSGSFQVSELRREPVAPLAPPCPCDAFDGEDIGALVSGHVTDNHNASIGLDPAALDGFSEDRTLELPCGRFYLSRIAGTGSAKLVVRGRSALFVGGDVDVGRRFEVALLEGAELDLFIAGRLFAAERLSLGSARFPSRLRVYVGGPGSFEVPASSLLAGNFHAPEASMDMSEKLELFGALLIGRLASSGEVSIHYDLDVLPPPTLSHPPEG